MNKHVSFEIAKLLRESGFDEACSHYYINDFMQFKHDGALHKTGLPNNRDSENIFQFVKRSNQPHSCNAPTISQVVMWLYEKHGIWVYANSYEIDKWCYSYKFIKPYIEGSKITERGTSSVEDYSSPTEAYESAILYVLKNELNV